MTLQTGINVNENTPLDLAMGGTGNSLAASEGGIAYSTATGIDILQATSTENLTVQSGANSAPSWSDYPTVLGGDFVTEGGLTFAGAFGADFTFTAPTTLTFPTSGTLATTSQLPSPGSPLPMDSGGTGASLTAVAGSIPYSGASAMSLLAPASAANKALLAQSPGSPPVWSPFRFIMGGDLITDATHTLSGAFASTFTFTGSTSLTFPVTGTLATTSQLPSTSNLVPLNSGGTAANLTAVAGAIPYSTASAIALLAPTAAANKVFLSQTIGSPPIWSTSALSMGGNITTAGALTVSGAFATTLTVSGTTTLTLPTTGTLATTSQLPTPAALTKTDDTNVTLTLGGTPTTALLQPASITAGWTGQLSMARGGSNASLTASNGGVVSSTGSAMSIVAGTATAGQMFRSGASTPGSWSTNTWPSTAAISTLLYASAANVISALATQNNGMLVTNASGVPSWQTAGTSYTPTITFFVPGDLSVAYTIQSGMYWRVGNLITVKISLAFIPTFTTAGSGVIISLPITVATNGNLSGEFFTGIGATNNLVYPVGRTVITPVAQPSTASFTLAASGTAGITTVGLEQTNIPSGVAQSFEMSCVYYA